MSRLTFKLNTAKLYTAAEVDELMKSAAVAGAWVVVVMLGVGAVLSFGIGVFLAVVLQ